MAASPGETRIRITFGSTVLTGRLWDNAPARDLAAQLPLTLSFSDYNGLEKIATVPRRLPLDGMPDGDDPQPADIGYFAPWGNLVLYYGDVDYYPGIMSLGRLDGDAGVLEQQESDFTATIELAD